MEKLTERDHLESDLAKWLLTAFESHSPEKKIQATLGSKFGLPEDEARIAQERARDGVLGAISGWRMRSQDDRRGVTDD